MLVCKYCNDERKNKNSLAQHEIRCQLNPYRIINSGFKGKNHNEKAKNILKEKAKKQHTDGKLPGYPSKKGTTHTQETKDKIAKALVGNNNGLGRGKRTEYKGIIFKSTWEAIVAQYLDENNVCWKYEEKHFLLDEKKSYRPDFFIYDENNNFIKLIEVKGYFREENKLKYITFKNKYPDVNIELWDKDVLLKLNLI